MPRINVLPHILTTVSSSEVVPLGSLFFDYQGRGYVFTYNFGATSTAVGDVASVASTFTYGHMSVTPATIADYTDGTTIRPVIAGVALSIIATTKYGWLWCYGRGTHTITTDTNVAANDLLTVTDGAIIATREVTAATAHRSPIGVAHAADSGTALTNASLFGDGIFPW